MWTQLNLADDEEMYSGCVSLANIPTSWSGLTALANAKYMFRDCSTVTTIPTASDAWTDLPVITNTWGMFSGASAPADWTPLANVTNTSSMLYNCTGITSDILTPYTYMSGKATPVTSYTDTFHNCTSATGYASVPSAWGGGGA